jgi:hypothetical protein
MFPASVLDFFQLYASHLMNTVFLCLLDRFVKAGFLTGPNRERNTLLPVGMYGVFFPPPPASCTLG